MSRRTHRKTITRAAAGGRDRAVLPSALPKWRRPGELAVCGAVAEGERESFESARRGRPQNGGSGT